MTFGVVEHIFREYTADRVLRNQTFIGELPFRDGWVPGAHEPLLDLDDVRPTFRLGGPALASSEEEAAAGTPSATAGLVFASQASEWSQGDSNP